MVKWKPLNYSHGKSQSLYCPTVINLSIVILNGKNLQVILSAFVTIPISWSGIFIFSTILLLILHLPKPQPSLAHFRECEWNSRHIFDQWGSLASLTRPRKRRQRKPSSTLWSKLILPLLSCCGILLRWLLSCLFMKPLLITRCWGAI